MAHKSMAAIAERPGRTRRRHAALQLPLHGARRQSAPTRPRSPTPPSAPPSPKRTARAGAAALRRRPLVRRPHDIAGAGDRRRCPTCAASSSSPSRCIPPASPATNAPSISATSRSRCSSCKATNDALATLDLLRPWSAPRQARNAAPHRRRRPQLPRARENRPQGCGRAEGDSRRRRSVDASRASRTPSRKPPA